MATLKAVKSSQVWFCKPCSEEWREDQQENAKMREDLKAVKKEHADICGKMKNLEKKLYRSAECESNRD